MNEWDELRKQCPDNPPIAIAEYIESERVQSYAISGANYAYNECTFLVFPDKIVQRFIPPKVESGFFSNDATVKTVWERSTKTFAIEASQSRSPEPPAVTAAAVAETLRSSPPTSQRSRSLNDGAKSKEGRSPSGQATEQIGRVSRDELKRISCYLIEQINKYLKRRKGVKITNITLAFRRDYRNEWFFLYIEKLKTKAARGHSKERDARSPTNGKREEGKAEEKKTNKAPRPRADTPQDDADPPPERVKLSRPASREKVAQEGETHKPPASDPYKETARHRKSNTHYV